LRELSSSGKTGDRSLAHPLPAGRVALYSFEQFDPRLLDESALLVGDRPRHVQISRGPLQGQADQIQFDKCALRIGSLSQTMKIEVEFPRDRATFGLALDARQPIRLLGKSFASHDLTLFGPGEEIDALFSAGSRWVTFNLPLEDFTQETAVISENPRVPVPRGGPLFRANEQSLTRLRGLLQRVEKLMQGPLQLSGDDQWRRNVERELTNGFFGLLDNATLLERGHTEARLPSARRVVQEAEATLDEEEAPIPPIADLCRKLGVSRRTLERAFQDALGVSPSAYFRIRALNAVRRKLLTMEPEPGIIARLALDQGFWHLSRFAQAYRAQFGERPVDTLRGR